MEGNYGHNCPELHSFPVHQGTTVQDGQYSTTSTEKAILPDTVSQQGQYVSDVGNHPSYINAQHLHHDIPAYHNMEQCEERPSDSLLLNDHTTGVDDYNGNASKRMDSEHQLPQNQQNTSKFVLLDRFRLAPKREGWRAVANLDIFFTSIYSYYYHRGLVPLVGKGIVELISLFFTLWLSVFLFAYLDWSTLTQCRDEGTCRPTLSDYIIEKPFATASYWNVLVITYLLLFTVYGFFSVLSFVTTVRTALESKYFFEEKLGFSAQKLEGGAVDWDTVVDKIVSLQQSGEHRVAIHGQKIDALVVAQRILRRENFMIAFINRKMLDLNVQTPHCLDFLGLSEKIFFSKSLEWSIYFCILSYMFNHKYEIRPAFYLHPESLKRRFTLCGIAHAIFMPFLIVFVTLHFFMQNIYNWRSTKQYLGPHEWSNVAKWTFREFNELPHVFERRLGPSYKPSEEYLKLFTKSSVISSFGRIMVFISGSLGAVLLVLAAVNDSILLHIKIGQWNLVWYVGILGVLYSVGNSLIPDTTVHPSYAYNLFAAMDSKLVEVASHTHHYPETWKNRGWDRNTKKSFADLFQAKAMLFGVEIISILLAPIILCISLPKNADAICAFVQKVKIEVPGAGEVCGYSSFDFDSFQDENWEGKTMGTDPNHRERETLGFSTEYSSQFSTMSSSNMYHNGRPMAHGGKMEKSFFNFKINHPHWKCNSSGLRLIERIENYKSEQAIALARERHQHLEAAARQLETLRRIESKQLNVNPKVNMKNVDENYMANHESNASPPGNNMVKNEKLANISTNQSNDKDLQNHQNQMPPSKVMMYNSISQNNSNPTQQMNSQSFLDASILHYTDMRLSTELQRVLGRSLVDYDASFHSQGFGNLAQNLSSSSLSHQSYDKEKSVQNQYLLLDQYHKSKNHDTL